jgi:hypothetical protein
MKDNTQNRERTTNRLTDATAMEVPEETIKKKIN